MMKIGVIVFPGTNGDEDVLHVMGKVLRQKVDRIWHKDTDLEDYTEEDIIFLPGGSAYGDHLRPGALAKFSPIMTPLAAFAEAGGTIVGICNGFQILCEWGMLDGTWLKNIDGKYISRNIHLRVENADTRLTQEIEKDRVLRVPVAHADGRYYADSATLQALEENKQIVFKYCDESGNLTEKSNVNGSAHHIAGIMNKRGNIYGILPHPERATEEILGNIDGRVIFESLIARRNASR